MCLCINSKLLFTKKDNENFNRRYISKVVGGIYNAVHRYSTFSTCSTFKILNVLLFS